VHRFAFLFRGFFLLQFAARAIDVSPIEAPGFRPRPPAFHALTGARVIVSPGRVLTNAMVVVSNGLIRAVTEQGSPPEGARVWDLTGATVYAGFIDPYLAVGRSRSDSSDSGQGGSVSTAGDLSVGPRFFGVPGQERDPGRPGAGAASREVTPELRLAVSYVPDEDLIESMRALGFAAAQVVPREGIIRGHAALVMLGDAGPNSAVLRADTAQCVSFDVVRGEGRRSGYPNSLMGVIALVRQTFFDAAHHAADRLHYEQHPGERPRPPINAALDALARVLPDQLILVAPESVLMVDRAEQIALELGWKHRAYLASGGEWRRPDLMAKVSAPFIVPLTFPALPKFPDDRDWEQVSLDELRAWDWAPETAAVLRRAGREVALSTHGMADRKEFRRNVRAAIDRGLSEDDALAALTLIPARLSGVENHLGTVEPGKIANFTVVEGSYFDPEARVSVVWVDGIPHELARRRTAQSTSINDPTAKASGESGNRREALREIRKRRLARESLADRMPPIQPVAMWIHNATIWTCGPSGVLTNATLLVRGDRIEAVGVAEKSSEPDALVMDGSGLHITPGLIDCHSHSMILGGVNEATLPSTAMVRIGDVVNSETANIRQQLAGGLTVANLLHGSANPIGGQNCVIKLRDGAAPEDLKFRKAPPGIKFALGENVKQSNSSERNPTRFPQSRMGVQTFYVNRFTAARQYAEALKHAGVNGGPAMPIRRDLELETLAEILAGTRLIHCHSYRQDEILTFLRTMESFGIRVATLQHVLEGYKVADEIARHGAGASAFSDWWAYKYEVIDAIAYAGSLMHERGVNVSFNSDSNDHARRLSLEAAKAVKYGGTPPVEALKFVTLNPARQLRIDAWVGSLEPGKDADFVIWSGDPLDSASVCLQTWIEGRKYFDRDTEPGRVKALHEEREALLTKARKLSERGADSGAADQARARFFQRALEKATHLGVVDCQDCLLP
jgi:imidazolonepropionase-like amidohydrolase